jgi:hypothetical protein
VVISSLKIEDILKTNPGIYPGIMSASIDRLTPLKSFIKMSNSAKSIFFYSVSVALFGPVLLFFPNLFLEILGMAPTDEIWIRIVGLFLLVVAVYYYLAAKHELLVIIKGSVFIRLSLIFFYAAFVLLKMTPLSILIIPVLDLLTGLWTLLALRKEGKF